MSPAAAPSTSSGQGAASSGTPPTASTGASAGSPVAAVESFYHLAASHQYSAAWALADPAFRNQLQGFQNFESSQTGDRSITFNNAGVVNQSGDVATVSVNTTSVRDNGTQHCSGTVDLIRSSGSSGWLLHQIHINCA